MRKELIPFRLPSDPAGMSLPFDLFNNNGVLVLQRGSRLDDPTRIGRLAEMRLYRMDTAPEGTSPTAPEQLNALAEAYAAATAADAGVAPKVLIGIADELHGLIMDHPDMCLGMMRHLQSVSNTRRQALFSATLGCLVTISMGLPLGAQKTLIRAALSMNLSTFALQDALNREARLPTAEECEILWRHPWQSADLLYRAGVTDTDWLTAVRLHHENLDRSGYPYRIGLQGLTLEARILRVVDVFAAMIGQRQNRSAYTPRQAMRLAFERERGHLDDAVMLTLRRVIGKNPPGTLVKLANRETAVITHWFKHVETPKFVVSLLWPSGDPMQQPRARNPRAYGQNIREYTTLPFAAPPLNWSKIWAQALP